MRIDQETVLGFLRSLRDRGAPAWQRLQAARALQWYQSLVLDRGDVDFAPFKRKLGELAARERRTGGGRDGEGGIPGEGLPGKLDPSEPEAVRALRARMWVLHHPKSAEEAYAGWLLRFIRHLVNELVEKYGEPEIGQFLTGLAVLGEVTAGTQNQALSALLFVTVHGFRIARALFQRFCYIPTMDGKDRLIEELRANHCETGCAAGGAGRRNCWSYE